ncbi:MAG: iron uptake system EfeUOB component EfeO/EfeM [Sulfurimonas sp.]|jgi:iron uptake system EfeUOB component EfeO/EfeM
MDPLSQLFAAYLHTVSNSIAEVYVDSMNTTVTSQSLVYNDTTIRFQHQLWKIKPNSVCSDLEQQATQFSQCTQQAKAMFTELCTQLSSMENLNQKGRSLSNMYCNASLTYKPMVAYISEPKQKTEQKLKEKECNLMILMAMQDSSPDVLAQKEAVCALSQ